MAGDTVQKIKDKLSIVDVVSQYVKLERSGANMRARCPFHAERTPSFFVSSDRGTYHCFGCNVGGDIFSFVEQIEGLDFKGALKVLAEKAGVEILYERGNKQEKDEREKLFELLEIATIFYSSRLSDDARKYLKERGIKDATVKEFRLGWAGSEWEELSKYLKAKKFSDKEIVDAGLAKKGERGLTDKFRNRIMFPISDSAGRVVGFSGRIFGEEIHPDAPKYLNSPETPLFHKSRILYGFDKAKLAMRKHNCAVLVEGQMDLLASYQAGWGNTVAVSGTAFTPEHAALLHRMTDNLVIALDADEAGFKAAGRAARAALLSGLNVKVAQLSKGLDPADLILEKGKEAWSKAIREAKDIITFLLDVLEEHAKSPDNFRRSVESIVLPFLADVQSPIAREQYLGEIARRLRVSEDAVREALERVPREKSPSSRFPELSNSDEKKTPNGASPTIIDQRARQAYAILLWQQSLKKAHINLKEYEQTLVEAAGAEVVTVLKKMPTVEKESLRFAAETMYGSSQALQREIETLLRAVLKDRLSHELGETTAALKKAEAEGDEKKLSTLMGVNKLLTKRIADLRGTV